MGLQRLAALVYRPFMKILKSTDIVTFKYEGVEIDASPIPYEKRIEAARFTKLVKDKIETDYAQQSFFYVKHSVKGMRGVTDARDQPVELEFGPDGSLTDASAQEVFAVVTSIKTLVVKFNTLADQRIPTLLNPLTGEQIEGLEIVVSAPEAKPGDQKKD